MSAVPGLTDSGAYVALFDLVTGPGSDLVEQLVRAAEFQDAADDLVLRLVQDARRAKLTWREIGEEGLGVSLQAAHQLHAHAKRRR